MKEVEYDFDLEADREHERWLDYQDCLKEIDAAMQGSEWIHDEIVIPIKRTKYYFNPNPDRVNQATSLQGENDMSVKNEVKQLEVYIDDAGRKVELADMSMKQVLGLIKEHKEAIKEIEDFDAESLQAPVVKNEIEDHEKVINDLRHHLASRVVSE